MHPLEQNFIWFCHLREGQGLQFIAADAAGAGRCRLVATCVFQVVGAWYRCCSQSTRRMCLRCYWQERTAQRIDTNDYARMEPDAPGSAHSNPVRDCQSAEATCNGGAAASAATKRALSSGRTASAGQTQESSNGWQDAANGSDQVWGLTLGRRRFAPSPS